MYTALFFELFPISCWRIFCLGIQLSIRPLRSPCSVDTSRNCTGLYSADTSRCSSGPCSVDTSRNCTLLCSADTSKCSSGKCNVDTSRNCTGLYSADTSRCSSGLCSVDTSRSSKLLCSGRPEFDRFYLVLGVEQEAAKQ